MSDSAATAEDLAGLDTAIFERFAPLIDCATEPAGWQHVVDISLDVFDADIAVCVEYVGEDCIVVRSGAGDAGLAPGTQFAIAPGSDLEFCRDTDGVVVIDDLLEESRFEPNHLLLRAGVRSSMTVRVGMPDGAAAVLGVHSSRPKAFTGEHARVLAALGASFGSAIRRTRTLEQLKTNAQFDPLTGLMNRSAILQRLGERFAEAGRPSVLLIDLDGFKAVNVEHGHRIGDITLQRVADRLERLLGTFDALGRLGGDEFLVVSYGRTEAEDESLADRVIGAVEEVIDIESQVIQLSASIGVARRRPNDDPETLLERADKLMYRAKEAGRGLLRMDETLDRRRSSAPHETPRSERRITATTVDEAIADGHVVVQPIVEIVSGRMQGVEVLARGPRGHPLEMPDQLFPAARAHLRLGDLELATKRRAFELDLEPSTMLYLNIEPVLLSSDSWLSELVACWKDNGGHPSITVELTERSMLRTPSRLLRAVDVCRGNGWKIALDDVGTRTESLAALRLVDPDVVKLDMNLIAMHSTPHAAHVSAAVALQRTTSLGADRLVVAEGIENYDDIRVADILGADLLQGYLFGRPIRIENLRDTDLDEFGPLLQHAQRRNGERVATLSQLVNLSRHIESLSVSPDAIAIASVQHHRHVSPRTLRQYESLAKRCGFVGLIGVGVNESTVPTHRGVRLASCAPDDPISGAWHVVSLTPAASIALIATEIPTDDDLGTRERLFSYRIESEPAVVERTARRLISYF